METALTKASPLTSKLGYWSKLAQAGDSSTTAPGFLSAVASRSAAATAVSSVPHFSKGNRTFERRGELLRGLTDQIGFRHAREQRLQRLDAARLGDAAGDPVDVLEGGQRLLRRIGIGGLGIIDEGNGAHARHLLHAVGKAGEALHGGGDDLRLDTQARGPRHRPCRRSASCGGHAARAWRARSISASTLPLRLSRKIPSGAVMPSSRSRTHGDLAEVGARRAGSSLRWRPSIRHRRRRARCCPAPASRRCGP